MELTPSKLTKQYNNVWMKAGLYEIDGLAKSRDTFSSDSLSEDLRATVTSNSMVGALFTAAVKKKLIVPVGNTASARKQARHRNVTTYRAAFYV